MAAMAGSASAAPLVLVKDGQPQATIIIDGARYPLREDITNQWATVQRTIRNIAAEVVSYIRKSTGTELPVIDVSAARICPDIAWVETNDERIARLAAEQPLS